MYAAVGTFGHRSETCPRAANFFFDHVYQICCCSCTQPHHMLAPMLAPMRVRIPDPVDSYNSAGSSSSTQPVSAPTAHTHSYPPPQPQPHHPHTHSYPPPQPQQKPHHPHTHPYPLAHPPHQLHQPPDASRPSQRHPAWCVGNGGGGGGGGGGAHAVSRLVDIGTTLPLPSAQFFTLNLNFWVICAIIIIVALLVICCTNQSKVGSMSLAAQSLGARIMRLENIIVNRNALRT